MISEESIRKNNFSKDEIIKIIMKATGSDEPTASFIYALENGTINGDISEIDVSNFAQVSKTDYRRLLETTEKILILRGDATSGNWSMRYIEIGVLSDGRAVEIKSLFGLAEDILTLRDDPTRGEQ